MKIFDPLHALILFDQKKIFSRKTTLRSSAGQTFLFIKVDTQLNWPRIIIEDTLKKEFILSFKDLKLLELEIIEAEKCVESFYESP